MGTANIQAGCSVYTIGTVYLVDLQAVFGQIVFSSLPARYIYSSTGTRKTGNDVHTTRVSDPYSFFTYPDPDPEDPDGGQYGSGSNPDPGL